MLSIELQSADEFLEEHIDSDEFDEREAPSSGEDEFQTSVGGRHAGLNYDSASSAHSDDDERRANHGSRERFLRSPHEMDETEYDPDDPNARAMSASARQRSDQMMQAWRRTNLAFLAFHVPSMLCLFAMLILTWNQHCSERIFVWSEIQVILEFTLVISLLVLNRLIPSEQTTPEEYTRSMLRATLCYSVSRLLTVILFVWWCIGCWWIADLDWSDCDARILAWSMLIVVVIQMVFIALVVVSLCCSCFCLSALVCFAWIRGGFRLQHPSQVKPASSDMIDALEEITFTRDEEFVDDTTTCVICLEEYVLQEKLNLLPCQHHFHPKCIRLWLETNKLCPICKRPIDESDESGTEQNQTGAEAGVGATDTGAADLVAVELDQEHQELLDHSSDGGGASAEERLSFGDPSLPRHLEEGCELEEEFDEDQSLLRIV